MISVDPDEVVRELNELRRGRGLDADDVHLRVGQELRRACDIGVDDSPLAVRRALVLWISQLLSRLPDDLQLAASVALALHPEATGAFLDRRISWLADHFDRDARTARRRIDQAFRMLSQHIIDQRGTESRAGSDFSNSWKTRSLKAILRLDIEPPSLIEERSVMATVEELDELVLAISAPRERGFGDDHRIAAQMIYGGEIVERTEVSPSHARFVVRLPRPLRIGQQHEYSIQFTAYPSDLLRPYYVLTPLQPCQSFALRARFDRDRPPSGVWRLNGLPPRAVDDIDPIGEELEIDAVGDVTLEFHDLRQGLSYGIRWSP